MAEPLVRFEHVWKRFRRGDVHDSLRDLLPALARRMTGRAPARADDELDARSFWALRDVSFTVAPGEALGIIGPNGAGKSTALKLLTRVLGPTRGTCAVQGRVGALIEVAAGFHPDLTGRENVFLQGAVMGMSRAEIARKFDAIVDFSGVEPFLDTPVKRYSSGMSARLGFAIAAHLDPDVLIVDEVLSVGDASFQRKALARVAQLVSRGTPVVLVTHQLDQVTSLCTKALVLDRGRVVADGAPAECIAEYLSSTMDEDVPVGAALVVKTVRRLSGRTLVTGGTLRLALEVIVHDLRAAALQRLAVRVSSALTGAVVFEGDLEDGGLQTPRLSSWFWVELALTLHTPAGPYHVEFLTRDAATGEDVAVVGGVYVTVSAGAPFRGAATGALSARVTHAAEFGVTNDFAAPVARQA